MKTIDEYIAACTPEAQETLNEMRSFIKGEIPEASEKISYGIPTFYLNGNLIHFAAFKDHYSLFPSPEKTSEFEAEIAPYRAGKGTLRFPIGKPIPWDVVRKVLKVRQRYCAKRSSGGVLRSKTPRSP